MNCEFRTLKCHLLSIVHHLSLLNSQVSMIKYQVVDYCNALTCYTMVVYMPAHGSQSSFCKAVGSNTESINSLEYRQAKRDQVMFNFQSLFY